MSDTAHDGNPPDETGYNGWSTKETWLVHLWLTNDPTSDAAWRAVAVEVGDAYRLADVLRAEKTRASRLCGACASTGVIAFYGA